MMTPQELEEAMRDYSRDELLAMVDRVKGRTLDHRSRYTAATMVKVLFPNWQNRVVARVIERKFSYAYSTALNIAKFGFNKTLGLNMEAEARLLIEAMTAADVAAFRAECLAIADREP